MVDWLKFSFALVFSLLRLTLEWQAINSVPFEQQLNASKITQRRDESSPNF